MLAAVPLTKTAVLIFLRLIFERMIFWGLDMSVVPLTLTTSSNLPDP